MSEVENYGGGHCTRLKINLCVYGVPLATYIKEGREEVASPKEARKVWGILLGLPSPSRLPLLFPIRSRREGKRGRGRRKGGPRPHPLSNLVWAGGGAHHLLALPPSLH